MNRIFLLFPIVRDEEEHFHPYLKYCNFANNEGLDSFLKPLYLALSIIDHEEYSGYFDHKVLASFYHLIERDFGKDAAILLMKLLNDWTDYQQMENYVPTDINVNGIDLEGGDILDAFMQCGMEKWAIIDLDALCGHPKSLKISGENGGQRKKSVAEATQISLIYGT